MIILRPTKEDLDIKYNSSKYRTKTDKICIYCGSIFRHGVKTNMFCGLCSVKYNCKECNKEVIIKISNMSGQRQSIIREAIRGNKLEEYEAFCNRACSNRNRMKPGICTSCKNFSNRRSTSGLCPDCQKLVFDRTVEKYRKPGNCVKCNKYTDKRSPMGICIDCMRVHINTLSKNNKKAGFCTVCKKYSKKRTIAGLCSNCNINMAIRESNKRTISGECNICKRVVKSRTITGICKDCTSKIISLKNKENTKPGKCIICNNYFEVRNSFGCCIKCSIGDSYIFDRDSFYKEKFNLISFDSIDKEISWDDIDSLNEVPGVWSVWASDNKCLDVCQTINIGREMLAWIRSYNACKDKTDEELIKMNIKHRRYNRKKKRDIAKYCSSLNTKPIFKVVSINIETKEQREAIESQYAHDNKAIFWNPGLGQKLIKGLHNKSAAFSNKIKI